MAPRIPQRLGPPPDRVIGCARTAADRVVMMDEGRIVEIGPPEQFFTAPEHDRTKASLAKIL